MLSRPARMEFSRSGRPSVVLPVEPDQVRLCTTRSMEFATPGTESEHERAIRLPGSPKA